MINRTSELAVKTLIYLALEGQGRTLSPRLIAPVLDCSPSYLAKTTGLLVKAGILRSLRGLHGGVLLAKDPKDITLLEVVEACQGVITPIHCQEETAEVAVCSFHEAVVRLHTQTVTLLSEWTIADLMKRPVRLGSDMELGHCRMSFDGCEAHASEG